MSRMHPNDYLVIFLHTNYGLEYDSVEVLSRLEKEKKEIEVQTPEEVLRSLLLHYSNEIKEKEGRYPMLNVQRWPKPPINYEATPTFIGQLEMGYYHYELKLEDYMGRRYIMLMLSHIYQYASHDNLFIAVQGLEGRPTKYMHHDSKRPFFMNFYNKLNFERFTFDAVRQELDQMIVSSKFHIPPNHNRRRFF